jgi:cytochrome P450
MPGRCCSTGAAAQLNMSRREKRSESCDNLLIGGTENTRIAASGGMLAFLQHPDQRQALSTEPELLHSAVEEMLRWTSTAIHIMRTATAPVTIHGRRIEAGQRVTPWNPSANRDESILS